MALDRNPAVGPASLSFTAPKRAKSGYVSHWMWLAASASTRAIVLSRRGGGSDPHLTLTYGQKLVIHSIGGSLVLV